MTVCRSFIGDMEMVGCDDWVLDNLFKVMRKSEKRREKENLISLSRKHTQVLAETGTTGCLLDSLRSLADMRRERAA